jgi:hypothetical protein
MKRPTMMNDERGLTMTTARLAIAVLVTVGLAGAPFAAEAKKYELKHYISTMQSDTYGAECRQRDPELMRHPGLLLEL